MSDGQAWGMCAAFGCPLFGTMGRGGDWYCFCHWGKQSGANDAVTAKLRSGECLPIVEATLDIRRCFSSFRDCPDIYRALQKRLADVGRRDLLLGEIDSSPHRPGKPIVKQWLARLERELMRLTEDIGTQLRMPTTVPSVPVIGPTYAMQHYTEKYE
ncbi:MAG: hypothetical protein ACTHJ9_17250 [Rhodanobacter sp.]